MKTAFLYIYVALMFACTTVLSLPVDSKRVSSESLDPKKEYAPNPPATHSVLLGIIFAHPETSKVVLPVTIDLYGTMVPKTVMNFYQYAERIQNRQHNDPSEAPDFDKILPNGAIEGGPIPPLSDVETGDLTSQFAENLALTNDRPGRVSMTRDDTGLKFMIWTGSMPYEGDNIVFGQVTSALKDVLDKLANVKTNKNGEPDEPITIDHVFLTEYKNLDFKTSHEQYLERLLDYQNGDLEKGDTLKGYLEWSNKRESEEIKFNQHHHPLPKISLGISVLLAFYVLAKYRKRIFSRSSSKIVSIRED
ncbi:cpr8p [Saccharomyces arboricola H-6]|uniref:Cpr8p n=1 Tax=Saccharomyces arboricola (strain H-6 / AS 2.3317 / CBS 10644) TaxID=1160507 RepID=J8PZR5_SACAR|nr:cpr8p [Saccharomyces arboricola H-6]